MAAPCFNVLRALLVAVLLSHLPESRAEDPTAAPASAGSGNATHVVIEKVTHLIVKVLEEPPFVMRTVQDPTRYEGFFIDVLDRLTALSGLSYEIHPDKEYTYGYEFSPGNWSGLVGALTKEGDDAGNFALAPLTIMSKRQAVVDYTHPVMSAGLRILYKVPDPWSDREAFAILLSPFTPGLWVVVTLMFAAVSIMFWVVGRFSPYEDHAFVGKAATYEGLTLMNSFLYVFSSLTFQGYTAAPRSISGRVLAAVWWMFVCLVMAAYVASLTAIFLHFKPSIRSLPFATFTELSQQNDVAYGIVRGGMTERYLRGSNRTLQRKLWGTMGSNSHVLVDSAREGIMRVQASHGKFALIMEGPMAEYLAGQKPCNLMVVGEPLSPHAYGFACKKNTDICSNVNQAIMQLQETDFIYEAQQKWFRQGCNQETNSEYVFQGLSYFDTFGGNPKVFADRAVTLRRFGTGFLLLFMGVTVCALVLVAEIFYAKRRGTAVPQRLQSSGLEDQQRIDREFRDEDA